MTVLVAAVLGVNLGIFAALYWQQVRRKMRLRARLRWYTLRPPDGTAWMMDDPAYRLSAVQQRYKRGLDRTERLMRARLRW